MTPERLYLTNVRVRTLDSARPLARSLTIADGRIVAVGGRAGRGARLVDCGGGVLLPGFVDPHVHLLAAAAAACSLDCSPSAAPSIAELQRRISNGTVALPAGAWLRAAGYDDQELRERRHPTRWELDAAAPGHPVRLLHRSGHAAVLNSRALALVGIDITSEEPPGGVIDRRLTDGEPNGLLIDMDAQIERAAPPLSFDELVAGMRLVEARLVRNGITAVQDLTHRNDAARLVLLDQLASKSFLAVRLLQSAVAPGTPGTGPIKLMIAESAGPGDAEQRSLRKEVARAHAAGHQVAIHAVTEFSVTLALDAIEAALTQQPRADHRHRIEHASICPPALAQRAAALGVVVVSNPAFLAERGAQYRRTVPVDDQAHLYAAGALLQTGVTVAAASDLPFGEPSPLRSVQAALDRRDAEGVRLPGESTGLDPALAMITRAAAFSAFLDAEHGVIGVGRRADLVLLSGDPAPETPPPDVWWTVVDGRVAWAPPASPQAPFPPLNREARCSARPLAGS